MPDGRRLEWDAFGTWKEPRNFGVKMSCWIQIQKSPKVQDIQDYYPLVKRLHMENRHAMNGNIHELLIGPFSIAMSDMTRGYDL